MQANNACCPVCGQFCCVVEGTAVCSVHGGVIPVSRQVQTLSSSEEEDTQEEDRSPGVGQLALELSFS